MKIKRDSILSPPDVTHFENFPGKQARKKMVERKVKTREENLPDFIGDSK